MRDLIQLPECKDHHCPHSLRAQAGPYYAPVIPSARVAWCCRCESVLCIPAGLDFEERTHGVSVPRLMPWRPWGQVQCCLTCGADVTLRCGCSAPLTRKGPRPGEFPVPTCSVDDTHAQTQASATPRCWCSFTQRVGRFAL